MSVRRHRDGRNILTRVCAGGKAIMTDKQKIALVTGSSSGIGYETALLLARNGFVTYATMRNMNKPNGIAVVAKKESLPLQVFELDVTDDRSVTNAINKILTEKKRIDVVVNNAGYGLTDNAFNPFLIV